MIIQRELPNLHDIVNSAELLLISSIKDFNDINMTNKNADGFLHDGLFLQF